MPGDTMPRCDFDSRELLIKLSVTIAADVHAITPVVERVMEIVREMKCAEEHHFEVETSLREALANAVIHGAKRDPEKRIQFCVGCDPERGLLIIVRDPGEGFDPASIPSPIVGENLFSDRGRGIFLINQLMDHVEFKRGGTEIHMRKY